MADTRGLTVNRDIYNFETMMYRVYDNIPAKHKHTLSALALQSTLDMRHYSNLGCKMYKACIAEKARLFSLSLGYCEDLQDSLNHLYDMDLLSGKTKCTLDAALDGIRGQLSRLVKSFEKQLSRGAEHREETIGGDSIYQEEG